MDTKDLKKKAISGSLWTVIETFSLQIVQFIVGIVLARLLGPDAFGLIAMTGIFLAISNVISDGGFEKALIQQKEITPLQINTVFYVNIVLGIVMAGTICLLSPYIARFFHEPLLAPVLSVLALAIPLDALGQTQRILLTKELQFKKISIAQICSSTLSGIVGITLAFNGFGVWALVFSSLTATFTMVCFFWIKSSWYPKLQFSYSSISKMVPFGLNVLASGILFFTLTQFNNFIVGKFYSKAELGLFNRGMKLPELITSSIQSVVLKISFPLFAKVQDNDSTLKRALRKTNQIYAFIAFPLLGFLFIDAKEVVLFLLTDKWLGCVIFLKLFCIAKLFEPLISVNRELLLAKGKANLLLRVFILTSLLEIIPILIFVNNGILYVAWISVICKVLQYLIYAWVISKNLFFPVQELVKWILPYAIIVLIVMTAVNFTGEILPAYFQNTLFLKLAVDFTIGLIIYAFAGWIIKLEEVISVKKMLSNFLKKIKLA